MDIKSKEIVLVETNNLKPNPQNRNKHGEPQIDRLMKLIQYQGFRNPIVVSNRSGMVVAGHGRLECAKRLKLKYVPVIFQDFDDEDQELSYQISDNAIAAWATLDLSGINEDLATLGPDFDLEMLGMDGFTLDPFEDETEEKTKIDKAEFSLNTVVCPQCDHKFELAGK